MAAARGNPSKTRDARELYELKQKAVQFYTENGVAQKMEAIMNSMFHENPADVYGHLANYFGSFAKTPTITKIKARQSLDSKGQSTIQTDVYCQVKNQEKLVNTSVSSSYSSPILDNARVEEKEAEDAEKQEFVSAAVHFLNDQFNNLLQGQDPYNQKDIDEMTVKLISDLKVAEDERLAKEAAERESDVEAHSPVKEDAAEDTGKGKKGSAGKSKGKSAPVVNVVPEEPKEKFLRGSNAVSAISQAACGAAAATGDIPLYQHIAALRFGQTPKEYRVPLPMVTIIQSGKAALGKLNCVKEFMVVPKPGMPLKESLPHIANIYNYVAKNLYAKGGVTVKNVNDVGALCPQLDKPEQGLDLLQEAITHLGLTPGEDFHLALNCAGHEMFEYEKGKYEVIGGQQKVPDDMVEFWSELLGRYPSVIVVIDPMRKQEKEHWMRLCERITERCFVFGDYVYNRPGELKDELFSPDFKSSGVMFKLEQMNTVSDILTCAAKMEEEHNELGMACVQGETTDAFLADMAVGMNARFLKLGAPCRGERVSKLNRLLQIEESLEEQGKLSVQSEYSFPHVCPPPPPTPEEGGEETQADAAVDKKDGKPETPGKKK